MNTESSEQLSPPIVLQQSRRRALWSSSQDGYFQWSEYDFVGGTTCSIAKNNDTEEAAETNKMEMVKVVKQNPESAGRQRRFAGVIYVLFDCVLLFSLLTVL